MKKYLLLLITLILFTTGCEKTKIVTNFKVNLQDNLEFEINSIINIDDIIKSIDNGKLDNKDVVIDTSKLGEQTLKLNINKQKYAVKFKIVDTTKPEITGKNSFTIEQNKEIDLLANFKVTDNSGEDIKLSIDGNYDLTKPGTYKVKIIGKDSSNNQAEYDVTINVKAKVNPPRNNNQISNSDEIKYIDGILIVNKTYSLPSNYNPGKISNETQQAFNEMASKANEDGVNIYIQSGFRSYETQAKLYNNYVKRSGQASADTYSARPGHSEHQTGLAFDVCSKQVSACINSDFDNTIPANWLNDHAYEFGFILRYPEGKDNITGYKYESWHYRYVGKELASKLYNNGNWITLEEHFNITSEYK